MLGAVVLLAALPAGEPIRSVDLQAFAPARYARYLGLAAGDAYEPERVREAVLRLFATGDFEDIVVTAEPGEGVLALVFQTKPSPRLRRTVVRDDRRISADTLLRHARLRKGEPLWPARLDAAAQDAAAGLVADGYLDASVKAEALPVADGAELVFTVQAGPRVELRFAQVAGFAGPPPLLDLLRPHHGDVFRRARAEQAAERMRERLAHAGHWRAEVELEETRAPGSRYVDLAFHVRPGPALSVDVSGLELSRGRRKALASILRDGAARPDALEVGAESIEDHLREEGYRDPIVRHRVEPYAGGERIVYDVTPGPPATVVAVEVGGGSELAGLVKTRPGMPLRDDLLAEDVRALRDALRERGHVDAGVEAVVRDGGGQLPVQFRVEPGPATLVERITVEATLPPGEEVTTELLLRAGQPYRVRALAADRSRVTTAYRNAGYLDAEVEPKVLLNEDRSRALVELRVVPGPRLEVGQILVTGLERTREEVVLREVPLERGRALSLEKLLEGQRGLSALGLFERVSITPLEGERRTRDVLVSLSEAPATTIAYGVGYSERDLFRGSVEVTRRNLFGLDRTLTAFARVAFRGQRFVLSYREPFFLGRRRDFFGTAFYDDEDRTSFDFTRLGGIAQTTRRFGESRAAILRLTYQATDVFNVEVPLEEIDRQFRTYTLAGPSASIVVDNRDNPLDARAGHFLSADLLFSLRVMGGAQFAKSFVQAARYTRLRRELTLALSARVGLAATFGEAVPDELPLPERFFAGGDYTIRGFEIDTAGPLEMGTNGELFPTGGNGLLLASTELRRDLGRALTLAAFFDLGNVYPLVSDISLSDLRYTAGLGLRYRTPLGPVRLDWGVKLNPRSGESGYRVHLTVGNAY